MNSFHINAFIVFMVAKVRTLIMLLIYKEILCTCARIRETNYLLIVYHKIVQ